MLISEHASKLPKMHSGKATNERTKRTFRHAHFRISKRAPHNSGGGGCSEMRARNDYFLFYFESYSSYGTTGAGAVTVAHPLV
jgi:hypothetical protein